MDECGIGKSGDKIIFGRWFSAGILSSVLAGQSFDDNCAALLLNERNERQDTKDEVSLSRTRVAVQELINRPCENEVIAKLDEQS